MFWWERLKNHPVYGNLSFNLLLSRHQFFKGAVGMEHLLVAPYLYKGYDVALVAVIEGKICATAMAELTLLLPSALVSEPVSADIKRI